MREPTSAQALIDWIHSARVWGEKAGLENTRCLLAALGNPERNLKMVHVAGTNGKGSTCAMVESGLRACGLKTGLYTSPFLISYNERIRLDGEPVGDQLLLDCGLEVWRASGALKARGVRPTAFELGTALAFLVFQRSRVDAAVIETGLGGRLDPTNVARPMACGIAAIGLDHMAQLGDSLEKIAGEKAGIIKRGVPVAISAQAPEAEAVLASRAREMGAPLTRTVDFPAKPVTVDDRGADFGISPPGLSPMVVRVNLPGWHQVENARLALCLLGLLKGQGLPLEPQGIARGLAAARWPGRLEWVGTRLLLDGAHNPQGAEALSEYCRAFLADRPVTLLTAMMADKQPQACARILAPLAHTVVCTQVKEARALDAARLAALYQAEGVHALAEPDIGQALSKALSLAKPGVVLAAGSLYLVGALRRLLSLPQ